jgi:hypothetical protein
MKNFINKLFGIEKFTALKAEADKLKQEATNAAIEAAKIAFDAKQTPKYIATAKGEPYVSVLETHVNKENLRNGFFELDWNDQFVLQLKQEGYGFDGDPDEEIVDRWFRTLCKDVANEEGVDMRDRGAGFINVKNIAEGKSEVS